MPAPTVDRKHLAMRLSALPDHPAPSSRLEQVRTPGDVAAEVLLAAHEEGDIEGRTVVDLGCGTGTFTVGAALLGARIAVGYDIDAPAVELARAAALDLGDTVIFHQADVANLTPDRVRADAGGAVDTVLMNPPFGADLASRARGGDRVFLSLAMRLAPRVYSLHAAHTEAFLSAFARDAGFDVALFGTVPFPLPARFAHHRSEVRTLQVGLYRFQKKD